MAKSENKAGRILLVDDEKAICDTIKLILSLDHHEVTTTTSSKEALSLFQRGQFDLVITDYLMPGLRGDELAAAIRRLTPNQRILMITAYGESLGQSGVSPLAADWIMTKPFDVRELRETVRRLTSTPTGPT